MNFGDVFFIEEKEYVWLFSDGNTISAAAILNKDNTSLVRKFAEKSQVVGENLLYCYVELETAVYLGCSANMDQTRREITLNSQIRLSNKPLLAKDIEKIKSEILKTPHLFKGSFIDYIQALPK